MNSEKPQAQKNDRQTSRKNTPEPFYLVWLHANEETDIKISTPMCKQNQTLTADAELTILV